MTLADLASIGGFVSGIAVVITLIFLLLQMRQANLNQRALMQQMRSARVSDLLLKATEPHLCENMNRAFANDLSMNDEQVRSFFMFVLASLENWQDSYFQFRSGTLDAASFASDVAILRIWAPLPPFRAVWQTIRDGYGSDYRDYIDGLLREMKPIILASSNEARWRENLRKELVAAA